MGSLHRYIQVLTIDKTRTTERDIINYLHFLALKLFDWIKVIQKFFYNQQQVSKGIKQKENEIPFLFIKLFTVLIQ